MKTYDHIIIGSGINSLVCAGVLSKAGNKVLVLERNDRLGGCIHSSEITEPGFIHDVFSGFHPLFVTSPGYAELGADLHEAGLEYVNTDHVTGVVLPDGRSLILKSSREENIAAFDAAHDGDGARYQAGMAAFEQNLELTFGLLGSELWRWKTARMILAHGWRMGLHGMADFAGAAMQSCRQWLESDFRSELVRALLAPWILHAGLAPESALSAMMGKLIAFTLEAAGMPIVKGGAGKLVEAFVTVIESRGGEFVTGADVESIITRHGEARAVRTADGREFGTHGAVICNVTPTQLYGRLLDGGDVPDRIAGQAQCYRYGRGDMQIHIALNEPPQWSNAELGKVGMLHLTPGLGGVSRAVNEAERRLLPETATIVVGQPAALDASRAPAGKSVLWVQLQELPSVIEGDAAGAIDVPADGVWTEEVRDAYARRIIDRIAEHAPNLKSSLLPWRALSPADLEAHNINLVGGDPYSGACTIDQFMLWRPLRGTKNHSTPVGNVFHIGASTHPGPGLGGTSGYLVAKQL